MNQVNNKTMWNSMSERAKTFTQALVKIEMKPVEIRNDNNGWKEWKK